MEDQWDSCWDFRVILIAGWWFGTFWNILEHFFSPYIGKNDPNRQIFVRGGTTTNQIGIQPTNITLALPPPIYNYESSGDWTWKVCEISGTYTSIDPQYALDISQLPRIFKSRVLECACGLSWLQVARQGS